MSSTQQIPWQRKIALVIPMIAGSPYIAQVLVDRLGDVEGRSIVCDCHRQRSLTTRFMDAFLRLLREAGAAEVVFLGPRDMVWTVVEDSARRLGLEPYVRMGERGELYGIERR